MLFKKVNQGRKSFENNFFELCAERNYFPYIVHTKKIIRYFKLFFIFISNKICPNLVKNRQIFRLRAVIRNTLMIT